MGENPAFTINDDGSVTIVELLDGLRITSVVNPDGEPTAPEGTPASIARDVEKDEDTAPPDGYQIPTLPKDVKKAAKAKAAEAAKNATKTEDPKKEGNDADPEGNLGNQVRDFRPATLEQRLTRLSDTINGYARNSNEFRALQSYMTDVVKSLVDSGLITEKFGKTLAKF